ncbi:MAG: acyl-CoA thioesterase [Saprospiraceae bacterium]|nr:acyl-CoA thioesterase [Saprospiraceae bacterium]
MKIPNNINKQPQSRYRIRFKDCDPLGHLYNTRYLDYMLEAREDHAFHEYDLNLEEYTRTRGLAWVIVHHEISYLREAARNEFVQIKSSLIYFSDKMIMNEYQMWNDDMSELKSLMWTKFLHIDLKMKKSIAHPEDIKEQLGLLIHPVEEKSFSERLDVLRKSSSQ